MTVPADRKRKLGESVPWQGHRQEQAARLAAVSGYQLKRGAAKPLLEIESEPGVAIRWALQITHPFTVQPEIRDLRKNINTISSGPLALVDGRLRDLQCWKDRAEALLPATDRELRAIPDAALRRLLRGGPDYADLKLGSFTHVKLYDELLEASGCADRSRTRSARWFPDRRAHPTIGALACIPQASGSCSGLRGGISGLGIPQEDLSQMQCSSGF